MSEELILKMYHTLAIAPHYELGHSSVICTHQGDFYSKKTVNQILEKYCLMFGSDLQGRIKATRKQLKYVKNPPILISELRRIGGFQVPHPKGFDSSWIFDLQARLQPLSDSYTEIILSNSKSIITSLPINLVEKRKDRAIRMLHEYAPLIP